MEDRPPVTLAVEGATDEIVLKRLMEFLSLPYGRVYGMRGKNDLLQNLARYNNAARFTPWLVLIDLNASEECAPLYIDRLLPSPAPNMLLRIAVRELESWLLADREQIASFLGIPVQRVVVNPDNLDNPKSELVALARRSRFSRVKQDIIPRPDSGAAVGPGYLSRMTEFANQHWRPDVAMHNSDSLRRCVEALQNRLLSVSG